MSSRNGLFLLMVLLTFAASLFLSTPAFSSNVHITKEQFDRIMINEIFKICEEVISDKTINTEDALKKIDKLYGILKVEDTGDGKKPSYYDLYGPMIRERQQTISRLIQLRKEEDEKINIEKRNQLENHILVNYVMNEKLAISAVLAKIKEASTHSPENPVPLLPAQTKSLYDMARDVRRK